MEEKKKKKNEKELNELEEKIKKNEEEILNLNKFIFELILNNNIIDKIKEFKENKEIEEENIEEKKKILIKKNFEELKEKK